MFKKRCKKCDKKVDRSFDFCPYCGIPIRDPEEYGMLGRTDNLEEFKSSPLGLGMPTSFGSFTGNFMEKMLGNAFKMLEKEMRNMDRTDINKIPRSRGIPLKTNFQLFVNGKKVNFPEFQEHMKNEELPKEEVQKIPEISEETLKSASKLPRKEAKTKLTRLKDKIIYELDTPGLSKIQNVLISKLENSIEVKAYTDKAVYIKTLPGKLPLKKYSIIPEEKLILEFQVQV